MWPASIRERTELADLGIARTPKRPIKAWAPNTAAVIQAVRYEISAASMIVAACSRDNQMVKAVPGYGVKGIF
jgi:hypothetical protein